MPNSPTVLFIEDQADIALMYQAALEVSSYTTAVAPTGSTGLVLVARLRPALVFLDIGLPDMSGLDVLERIRGGTVGTDPRLPVVILTNYSDDAYRQRATALGALDYVVKTGLRPSTLTARVDGWLEAVRDWPADYEWDALVP